MSPLAGGRIALLETRLASEMADLVRREGGEPISAPAVFEAPLDVASTIPTLIDDIRRGQVEVIVFLTGAGVTSLFKQAEALGLLVSLVDALATPTTLCRGPKPAAALRRHGVVVHAGVQPPHTTTELLAALASVPVEGRAVVILDDGGTNVPLVDALMARGAKVQEIRAYEWQLPADITPLEQLIDALIDDRTGNRIDAVAFTSQIQARHLFQIAGRPSRRASLARALNDKTIVGSIGPTCSTVLEELGVVPHVVASPPRMRPLITAIGARLAARRHTPSATFAT